MSEIKPLQNGIMVTIKVKPNSPKFKIEREKNRIIVNCQSPPEDNQANKEIIKELENLTRRKVKIVRGLTSKKKSIIIHNITEKEFEELIS
ncbi:MAG: hypothetical protein GF368_00530 [Candidatus Aenigmarchaeota archaeon]|nr:hypothetical protein [Candidatus Aenigmarchaeota archaeon]